MYKEYIIFIRVTVEYLVICLYYTHTHTHTHNTLILIYDDFVISLWAFTRIPQHSAATVAAIERKNENLYVHIHKHSYVDRK